MQWPAVADVGMAAEAMNQIGKKDDTNSSLKKKFGEKEMLDLSSVCDVLEQLLKQKGKDNDAEMCVSPLVPELLNKDRFPVNLQAFVSQVAIAPRVVKKVMRRSQLLSEGKKTTWTLEEIKQQVESGVKPLLVESDVELTHSTQLTDIGLDSLAVVDLVDGLRSRMGVDLAIQDFLKDPTIDGISAYIFSKVSPEGDVGNEESAKTAKKDAEVVVTKKKPYMPDILFGLKVQNRNKELYEAGFHSYMVTCSRGFHHEVVDSLGDDSSNQETVNIFTNLNFPVCNFAGLMIGLKKQGYRVITIAQSGLERTEFDNDVSPEDSPAERVHTNIELMDTILRQSGDENPSYHVVGHSYGAACAILLALRAKVSPDSSTFLRPPVEGADAETVETNDGTGGKLAQDCNIKSLTLMNWAANMSNETLSKENFKEFFFGVGKDKCLGGKKVEAHLLHIEAASNSIMWNIQENCMPMYKELDIPVLLINTKADECYNTEQVMATSEHFPNVSVVIENKRKVILMTDVHHMQHFMLFGPKYGEETAGTIDTFIKEGKVGSK